MENILYQVSFNYTSSLLRKALFFYFIRRFKWAHQFIVSSIITCVIYFSTLDKLLSVLAFFGLPIIGFTSAYLNVVLATTNILKKQSPFMLAISEHHLTIQTQQRISSVYPWSALDKVWRHPDYWLITMDKCCIILPLQHIPEQAQQFILDKMPQAGKITH